MYIYPYSLEHAIRHDERDRWRASYQTNCNCTRAIEKAIDDNYDGRYLSGSAVALVLSEYGFDRVNWVLANTIQERIKAGQISGVNKAWAREFAVPKDNVRLQFVVNSHPGLVNTFVNNVRRAWLKLGLFDNYHCAEDNGYYDGMVLVLDPKVLKDEYKSPDYQLFLADGGFGCSPTARGRAVYGQFLKDGEETVFYRQDFIGVLKDEHLPDWARERLAEIQTHDSGPQMGQ